MSTSPTNPMSKKTHLWILHQATASTCWRHDLSSPTMDGIGMQGHIHQVEANASIFGRFIISLGIFLEDFLLEGFAVFRFLNRLSSLKHHPHVFSVFEKKFSLFVKEWLGFNLARMPIKMGDASAVGRLRFPSLSKHFPTSHVLFAQRSFLKGEASKKKVSNLNTHSKIHI